MLRKLFILLSLVVGCASSARAADYVIIPQGADRPVELRNGTEPTPGIDCPKGSRVKVFAPLPDEGGNPDTDYRNYILVTGGLRRVPPTQAVDSKAPSNIDGFFADLAASDIVSDGDFAQALRCKFIADKEARDSAIVRYALTLSPEKLQTLLGIAQANNIELPLGQ